MPDQQITCATCGQSFTWSAGEQQYYREHGLQAPRRCPDCRRAARQQAPAARGASSTAPPPSRPMARGPSPRRTFGVIALVAAVAVGAGLLLLLPAAPLLAWLIAINLITLLAFGYDKAVAGSTRTRVPEAILLGLALIGGSVGAAVGMLLFRHKTSKPAFLIPFALIVLLQLGLILVWPSLWRSF